jgi:hypothetical protein
VVVVRVKSHYQAELVLKMCAEARVAVGDLLAAKVEGRTITTVQKRPMDRELALALNEVNRGHVKGHLPTASATIRALRRRTA